MWGEKEGKAADNTDDDGVGTKRVLTIHNIITLFFTCLNTKLLFSFFLSFCTANFAAWWWALVVLT